MALQKTRYIQVQLPESVIAFSGGNGYTVRKGSMTGRLRESSREVAV